MENRNLEKRKEADNKRIGDFAFKYWARKGRESASTGVICPHYVKGEWLKKECKYLE